MLNLSGRCQMDHGNKHPLEVSGLEYHYGSKCALKGVNFSITCGNRLAILGPNGAGKTTFIRLLAGLLSCQQGEISWRSKPIRDGRREIAYLPQIDRHQQNFPIRVRDVVAMGRFPHLGHFGRITSKDRAKIDQAIEVMNLEKIANRQIDQLSGGQQQRTFIARALAQEAHVLLLDEPFNGLDVESRCHLADNLRELSNSGHLIIASHHQLETVVQIFTEALVLDQTQIAFGDAAKVMNSDAVREILHSCHPNAHARTL